MRRKIEIAKTIFTLIAAVILALAIDRAFLKALNGNHPIRQNQQ